MEPKTKERLISFRKNNRKMPRRRLDLPAEKITFMNPEFLARFTSETGKILPRRITGISAKLHRRVTREVKRARCLNMLP
ncbi:MAG: 30S ribosomal protein S18 [Verrucomicrobiales bacterium]